MASKNPTPNFQQIDLVIKHKLSKGIYKINLNQFKNSLKDVLLVDLKTHLNSYNYKGDLKLIRGQLYYIHKGTVL